MKCLSRFRIMRIQGSFKQASRAVIVLLFWIPNVTSSQSIKDNNTATSNDTLPIEGSIGLLAVNWPEYFGADEKETIPAPFFDLVYTDRYFINDEHGVGLFIYQDDSVKLGISIAYLLGRDEDSSDDLQGLGDVDAGATVNVFGDVEQYGLLYGVNVGGQVTGESTGYFIELDVEKSWVLDNKFVVSPGVGLNLVSKEFAESYFGVNAEQSAASGKPVFEPSAGIKSVGLNLGFAYLYSQKWRIVGGVEYERYLSDIADSPVTEDENQVTMVLGIAYQL